MRVHILQHVAFEGLGSIESYLLSRQHALQVTALYRNEPLPAPDELDWLIVLGGPMGVDDTDRYPWLEQELACIGACITAGKRVLGICLGAQLLAKALGAQVRPNAQREIGWFELTRVADPVHSSLVAVLPPSVEVFHWHSDTFDIPADAILVASSAACAHQAFLWGDRVLGLQFHLETTFETARALISHCSDELDGSASVQAATQLLAQPERFGIINALMDRLLEAMATLPEPASVGTDV